MEQYGIEVQGTDEFFYAIRLICSAPTETSADELRERCLDIYGVRHLQSRNLSPQMIAELAFISTRYLHLLFFHADLTVADYFRRSRLTKPLDVHLVQDVR